MGDILQNPPSQPNTSADSWEPLVDLNQMSYYGLNKITLSNWDASTAIPLIAAGSTIDIDGSLARFPAPEVLGGAPADGTVYVKFVVSGTTVTAELTAEAPLWTADKGGWYSGSGDRYSGHYMQKSGTSYTEKERLRDEAPGSMVVGGGVNTDNVTIRCKQFIFTAVGGINAIPHGLDWTKIRIAKFSVYNPTSADAFVADGTWSNDDSGALYYDVTNISFIPGGPNVYHEVRVLIWYEAS